MFCCPGSTFWFARACWSERCPCSGLCHKVSRTRCSRGFSWTPPWTGCHCRPACRWPEQSPDRGIFHCVFLPEDSLFSPARSCIFYYSSPSDPSGSVRSVLGNGWLFDHLSSNSQFQLWWHFGWFASSSSKNFSPHFLSLGPIFSFQSYLSAPTSQYWSPSSLLLP